MNGNSTGLVHSEIAKDLTDVHRAWLTERAAEQTPPLTASAMLARLIDAAIVATDEAARRRGGGQA